MVTVKCANCEWRGLEEDLLFVEDKSFVENSQDACPNCKTDEYLMDIKCDHKEFNKDCVTCLDILNVCNYAEKEGLEEFFDWSAMVKHYFKPEPEDDEEAYNHAERNAIEE